MFVEAMTSTGLELGKGTSINDVPRFLAFFDLPTYLPMSHLVLLGKSCLFDDVLFCLTYPP